MADNNKMRLEKKHLKVLFLYIKHRKPKTLENITKNDHSFITKDATLIVHQQPKRRKKFCGKFSVRNLFFKQKRKKIIDIESTNQPKFK